MTKVEVEVRSFISKRQYNYFLNYFRKKARFLDKEKQLTYYLSGPKD